MKTFQRISIMVLALSLVVAADAAAQTNRAPATRSNRALDAQRAMSSLVGRTLYGCDNDPAWIEYFDGADSTTGQSIPDNVIGQFFQSGDKILIRKAKTDMVLTGRDPKFPTVMVSLTVEDQEEKVVADVKIEVSASEITPRRVWAGMLSDNVEFSSHPVSLYPAIGMTREEVDCKNGVPEQTNSDALGGDQLVYLGGKLLVYINPHTDRVTNVQSSF